MREIKFRGKDLDGKWRHGSLVNDVFFYADTKKGVPYIFDVENVDYDCLADLEDGDGFYEMRPETIGEFTGLKDKEGKEIYEGDIVHEGDPKILYQVVWRDCGLQGRQIGASSYIGLTHGRERLVVVGNIHDNPELLNREGDTPMPVMPHKFNVGDTIRMKDSIAWSFTITDICKDSYIGKGFSLKFEVADMDWELVEEKKED